MKNIAQTITGIALWLSILMATVGAWVQHFITSVSEELWVLLVIGAIVPPVGVLHGWLVWMELLS